MTRLVHVAVGVIIGADGKIFIAKRAEQTHQGGLWEFPGGKVDAGESIQQALVRELQEELAIEAIEFEPLIKIRHDYGDKTVLLDVWKVTRFTGEPRGNEGQPVRWVNPSELNQFEFPAANRPIITAINLPQRWLITGAANSADEYLACTESALKSNIKLVQLRLPNPTLFEFSALANSMASLCSRYSAKLQLNTSAQNFLALGLLPSHIGLHLNTKNLMQLQKRPIEKKVWLSASCHNAIEINHAQNIGVDFICLSPLLPTNSHPEVSTLGWDKFSQLVEGATIPVFALGGMSEKNLSQALAVGAQGIAGISNWWVNPADKNKS